MSYSMKQFEALEDKYDVRCTIHEEYDCGKLKCTVYRLARDESEKDEPLPEEFLRELSLLYGGRYPLLVEKFLDKISLSSKRSLSFPFEVSPTSKTIEEVHRLQESWNNHCELFNSCF